jgi:hypothetical protein
MTSNIFSRFIAFLHFVITKLILNYPRGYLILSEGSLLNCIKTYANENASQVLMLGYVKDGPDE